MSLQSSLRFLRKSLVNQMCYSYLVVNNKQIRTDSGVVQLEQCHRRRSKGPSTRVRICVRMAVRFRARFVRKQNREPIIFLLPIAMVCLHISAKNNQKSTCLTSLAANRTPNRMRIRLENRMCRRPLKKKKLVHTSNLNRWTRNLF
jgi:hypothetical protein